MGAPRLLPSDSTLEKWQEEGLTHQEMADRVLDWTGVSVSRSSVSAALHRAGLTNRVRYSEVIPWSPIRSDHNHAYALSMLRILARKELGKPVTEDQHDRFESWSKRLDEDNACVAYVYNSDAGFIYVPRRPGIDGLVRKV